MKQSIVPISNQSPSSLSEKSQPSRQQESNLANPMSPSQLLSSSPTSMNLNAMQMMHLQRTIGNQAFLQLMKNDNTSMQQNKKSSNEN